jgi:hypothetical protein
MWGEVSLERSERGAEIESFIHAYIPFKIFIKISKKIRDPILLRSLIL